MYSVCNEDSFICDDGMCLQPHVRCDNVENCADFSDENCDGACDLEKDYECNDGVCKSGSTWCDSINDCRQGEDEMPGCGKL